MVTIQQVVCVNKGGKHETFGPHTMANVKKGDVSFKRLIQIDMGGNQTVRVVDPRIKTDYFNSRKIAEDYGGSVIRHGVLDAYVRARKRETGTFFAAELLVSSGKNEGFQRGRDVVDFKRGLILPAEYMELINQQFEIFGVKDTSMFCNPKSFTVEMGGRVIHLDVDTMRAKIDSVVEILEPLRYDKINPAVPYLRDYAGVSDNGGICTLARVGDWGSIDDNKETILTLKSTTKQARLLIQEPRIVEVPVHDPLRHWVPIAAEKTKTLEAQAGAQEEVRQRETSFVDGR